MTCERYWREGILLVERGLDDPHRDGCADCTLAHAARKELIEWLPLVGEGHTGDPRWQAGVWRQIDGERTGGAWRWRWQLAGVLAAACIVVVWLGVGRHRPGNEQTWVDVITTGEQKRSGDPHVDDDLRATVGPTSEVWIYQDKRLVLRCRPREASPGCTPNSRGMVVKKKLRVLGDYAVLRIDVPVAAPRGQLDEDLAALRRAGIEAVEDRRSVH